MKLPFNHKGNVPMILWPLQKRYLGGTSNVVYI